jgi:hypothetical protein
MKDFWQMLDRAQSPSALAIEAAGESMSKTFIG